MDDPEHIAAGVRAICERLQTKAPEARILLLAIFPRGAEPGDKMRINNTRANKLIASLADGDRIRFVDIGSAFLTPDGRLSREIMPDLLHPNAQGYRIWANRLARLLDAMLATASRG
jgi:lysophospholipase L1-like esterase